MKQINVGVLISAKQRTPDTYLLFEYEENDNCHVILLISHTYKSLKAHFLVHHNSCLLRWHKTTIPCEKQLILT